MRRRLACGSPGVSAEPLNRRSHGSGGASDRFPAPARPGVGAAAPEDLEDAEDTAAVLEWKVLDAARQTTFVPTAKQGAGWACPGEPAGRLRRTSDQPGRRVPRGPARASHIVGGERPAGSFPYGSPDLRSLRVGRYQVLNEITEEAVAVRHIARGTAGWTWPEIVRAAGPDSGQCASQPGTVREPWVKTMLAPGSEIVMISANVP
jgi:hypothetical protein